MSELLESMKQARAGKKAQLDTLLAKTNPTSADVTRADTLLDEVRDLDERIGNYAESERREEIALRNKTEMYGPSTERLSGGSPYGSAARVTSEPSMYTERGQHNGGPSFLLDLYRAQVKNDSQAHERLARHGREVESRQEVRTVATSDVPSFVPPAYLTTAFAEYARAGRPLVNQLTSMPLPSTGLSVVIPKVTTASTVAAQGSQGTSVSTTDIADTSITVPVTTVAGYVPVSRQSLERGVLVEQMIFNDLASAYAAMVDSLAIDAVLAQTGTNAITWTDNTDPTAVELWGKLADAAGRIRSTRFTGPTAFVLHPRRWAWLQAALSSTFPLVGGSAGAINVATETNPQYGGSVGTMLGVPVIVDANVVTTLGTSTNQDEVYVLSASESHLWEDANAPLFIRTDVGPSIKSLGVDLVVYGYSAFTHARYSGASQRITGSGLVNPFA